VIDWSAKKVLIVGAARQGTALARYLVNHGSRVVLNDRRSETEMQNVREDLVAGLGSQIKNLEFVFGDHPTKLLTGVDLVCPSGGVPLTLPLIQEALARGIPLSNDSQIFLEAAPCPVIGITGSAGKTTTTTLVGRMAQAALGNSPQAGRAFVGGNIGSPLISDVDDMSPADLAVMELSSFQLEIMTRSPRVAAVLNITPNHLDRHASMDEYTAAKARILDYQSDQDAAVLSRDDPGSWALAGKAIGRLVTFGLSFPDKGGQGTYMRKDVLCFWDGRKETPLLNASKIELRGEHNLQNVLAACAIAIAAGISPEAISGGVQGFRGVSHRLEFVRAWGGANWYNDSIATAPERSAAAVRSFDEPIILMAGGRDKNLPWGDLISLIRARVDHLILFGEAGEKVYHELEGFSNYPGSRPFTVDVCSGLNEAVLAAARVAEEGDVVLLSPGGTSFDQFRDFEDRGEAFRRWVMDLP
jgi:UDP-N-acetylmuramoylalanine--D-glutamate ligase